VNLGPEIILIMISPTRDSSRITDYVVSGSESRVLHLIQYCENQKIPVQIITNNYGARILNGRTKFAIKTIQGPRLLEKDQKFDLLNSFCVLPIATLKSLLRQKSGVFVTATGLFPDAFLASISKILGRRSRTYFHHFVQGNDAKSIVSRALQILSLSMLRLANVDLLTFPQNRKQLARLISPEHLFEFENGVEKAKSVYTFGRRSDVDVLYLGRVSTRKGSRDLIEIWKRVVALDPNRKLTVAGSIEDKNFESEVRDSGLDVKVLGPVSEAEKTSLLDSASCFISASREEGWGLAVSEAIAFGLPVVAYNLPAYAYAGESISRAPIGDYEVFAKLVLQAKKKKNGGVNNLKSWQEVLRSELSIILSKEDSVHLS